MARNPEWWGYMLIAISLFFLCLLLNYIVKKINEAHLEARLIRLEQKSPASQSTQVQGPLIEMEAKLSDIPRNLTSLDTLQNKEVNRTSNEKTKPEEITPKNSNAVCNNNKLDTSHNEHFTALEKESPTLEKNRLLGKNITHSADSIKNNEIKVNIPSVMDKANNSNVIQNPNESQGINKQTKEIDFKTIGKNGTELRTSQPSSENIKNHSNEIVKSIIVPLPTESNSSNVMSLNCRREIADQIATPSS